MASKCGTRRRYIDGCRCDECRAANRTYQREWAANRGSGQPVVSIAPSSVPAEGPGAVEVAVNLELDGLAQAVSRPGLTQTALALARIMDNPKALNQQPAAAAKLVEVLDKLRKGADAKKSRLASVRDMTKPHSATG